MDTDIRARLLAEPEFQDRYEGLELVGDGAFGSVYKTFNKHLGMAVAIKVLTIGNTTKDINRFRNEASTLAKLTSPFVVRIYSPFIKEKISWIEMEWVDGTNLEDLLRQREPEPVSIQEAVEIAWGTATGLAVAHEAGVVHRDVKPANILLPKARNPVVKLGDFGISKAGEQSKLTDTGMVLGSPQFLSPEAVLGKEPSSASDIYALGEVLYYMLSGNRAPFPIHPGSPPIAWANAKAKNTPTPLRQYCPTIPEPLDQLVTAMMAKAEKKRPSAAGVVEALTKLRERLASDNPPQPAATPLMSAVATTIPKVARQTMGLMIGRARTATMIIVGVGVVVGALVFRSNGDGSAPNASSAVAAPAASTTTAPAPTAKMSDIRVSLVGDELKVKNGAESLDKVELELVGRDRVTYRMRWPGTIGAGEVASAILLGFDPTPPEGAQFTRAVVRAQTASGPRQETFELQ